LGSSGSHKRSLKWVLRVRTNDRSIGFFGFARTITQLVYFRSYPSHPSHSATDDSGGSRSDRRGFIAAEAPSQRVR
jgi:hypothetical protein